MDKLAINSQETRRARTKSLIQLGGLIAKAGLLESFGINLGEDLQQSLEMKLPVAALFKGLLELNEMAQSEDVHMRVWGEQGLEAYGKLKKGISK